MKLTEDQEAQIPTWIEKWRPVALKCGKTDWDFATKSVRRVLELNDKPKVPVFAASTPLEARWAAPIALSTLHSTRPLDTSKIPECAQALVARILSETPRPGEQMDFDPLEDWYHPWFGLQFHINWAAYTSFHVEVLGWDPGDKKDLELAYRDFLACGSYCYLNHCFAIVVGHPDEIHLKDNKPHRDCGPAIVWGDFNAYFLDGVEVPEWIALPRAEELDPKRIQEIKNDEIRRRFVNKVGIERIYQALGGEVLDTGSFTSETGRHDYELVALKIYNDTDPLPYLKMQNPSLEGVYHLERVPRGTTTFEDAWLSRSSLTRDQVDENGAEWIQQGDVILRPKGAKKYRMFPKVLT